MTNIVSLAGFETVPGDATPFHGMNKWPSDQDLPGFRKTMEEYHREMHLVAKRCVYFYASMLSVLQHCRIAFEDLLWSATCTTRWLQLDCLLCRLLKLLAIALDLPANYFEERFSSPVANIRAVHYLQGQPSNPEAGIFGVGEPPHQVYAPLRLKAWFVHVLPWAQASAWVASAETSLKLCPAGIDRRFKAQSLLQVRTQTGERSPS